MYGGAVTNPEITGTAHGFAAGGRWYPLALTRGRIEAARIAGIDLVNVGKLLDNTGRKRLVLLVQAVYIAAGGQDDKQDGIANAGERITPEQFGRMMADPVTFEKAGKALILAAEHFRDS
jgi:hypothetical protein